MAIEDAEGCIKAIRSFSEELFITDHKAATNIRGTNLIGIKNCWSKLQSTCEFFEPEVPRVSLELVDKALDKMALGLKNNDFHYYLQSRTEFNIAIDRVINRKLVPLLRPI